MAWLDKDNEIRDLLGHSRTIAIVGLSDRPVRDSYDVGSYLLRVGYTVYPVNPHIKSTMGVKAYPSLEAIGAPVDIVNVFRKPEYVPEIVGEVIRLGLPSLWLQLGVVHPDSAAQAVNAGVSVVAERCIMVEHRRLIA